MIRALLRMRGAAVAAAMVAALIPAGAVARAPDPFSSAGPMPKDHPFTFKWRTNRVPPAWMQPAITTGAADSNATRASRAPTFTLADGASNWIMYGKDAGCGPNGIACYTRSVATTSFTMSIRPQGHRFDWGVLRWCQAFAHWPDGCYDVENVALDEFGHVTGLEHHVNAVDASDYLDAVVQTVSRTKPRPGWDVHAYGRCDVARLQQRYDVPNGTTKISTCISLVTALTLSAPTSAPYGTTVAFSARLSVMPTSGSYELGGNTLDGRVVVLQRRAADGTWTDVVTMTPGPSGTYTARISATTTADWQAVFRPNGEGLKSSTSPVRRVTVTGTYL